MRKSEKENFFFYFDSSSIRIFLLHEYKLYNPQLSCPSNPYPFLSPDYHNSLKHDKCLLHSPYLRIKTFRAVYTLLIQCLFKLFYLSFLYELKTQFASNSFILKVTVSGLFHLYSKIHAFVKKFCLILSLESHYINFRHPFFHYG